ncbi:hypothetical protein FDT66_01650 [Polaribacter aestuariivivens]|uniref:Uncharacterized protein n=1 Tax=Polaribacter aestuariivivens TaxID=2304626 RepID=A0A5S3NAF5_9FLAO|nr:hypothetical protein [Polaribacter aestuariivivens]TMM32195.1 hypothetical protein FDT66_01650 [Polaribacter aestuariivivens]
MNLKRTFGAVLTTLGIIGLIYTGYMVLQGGAISSMIVFGILGFIFFAYGISLVRTTKDEA